MATTRAQEAVNRAERTRDSVAAAILPPPGARAGRQLAVGTTRGRRLLERQHPVYGLFAARGILD